MFTILHFSDVHLPPGPETLSWWDFNHHRRIAGYLNYLLLRRPDYRSAPEKLRAIEQWGSARRTDLALFTGDISQIGAPGEIRAGRSALSPFRAWPHGLTLIPGNHDRYIPEKKTPTGNPAHETFDALFADWYHSDLPVAAAGERWPMVRLLPENLAIVSLSTVIPQRWCWNAFGEIPAGQIAALEKILASEPLSGRFILIAIHHAPFRPDGCPDTHLHGLHRAADLLTALRPHADRCAIVHGHIHHRSFLQSEKTCNIPIFGAGSATREGQEGFWLYEFDQSHGRAIPGTFRNGAPQLEEPAVDLGLSLRP